MLHAASEEACGRVFLNQIAKCIQVNFRHYFEVAQEQQ